MAKDKSKDEDKLLFHLEGKVYDIDDFELGELEWLEDELEQSVDEINFASMKTATRIALLIKRRENSEYTLDEARKLKLSVFDEEPEARPTKARKGNGAGPQT